MEFSVTIDDETDHPHYTTCPSRSTVGITVRWKPIDASPEDATVHCNLSYITIPGTLMVGLPPTVTLHPDEGEPKTWTGHIAFEAPLLAPLRIRVELRPAFRRAHITVLHVIPKPSAWIASGLVASALGLVAVLLAMTLATLRITMTQAATQVSSVALLAAALLVLKRALAALRPDHLPFLGVSFLIHRSLLACAIGFLALFAVMQSCFVVIHNNTGRELTLKLHWLDGETTIAPQARISVIPPSIAALRTDLLALRGADTKNLPLCVDDGDDPVEQKTPCFDDKAYAIPTLRDRVSSWFTPPTLELRCGQRWEGLSRARIVGTPPATVKFEGESVWITPEVDALCGEHEVELWYRHEDDAVHRVRFPWRPDELNDTAKLFVDAVDLPNAASHAVTLRTVPAAAEAHGPAALETRIALTSAEGLGVALANNRQENPLTVQIGDPQPRITELFAPSASLQCQPAPGSKVVRATQLVRVGPEGWVTKLELRSLLGLSWTSTWTLVRGSSPAVATPWVCEGIPGDDPNLAKQVAFGSDSMTLVLDDDKASDPRDRRIILPARLMSRQIVIQKAKPDGSSADPVGRLECEVKANVDENIVIGAVTLVRNDRDLGGFTIDAKGDTQRWHPEGAKSGQEDVAWLCWRADDESDDKALHVTLTPEHSTPIENTEWSLRKAGTDVTLELPRARPTVCYVGADLKPLPRPPSDFSIVETLRGADVSKIVPSMHKCHTVHRIKPKAKP